MTGPEYGATVRVRGADATAARMGTVLALAGWTPVPDGPADAEVATVEDGFRVHAAGVTAHVTSWAELASWAGTTRGGAPRRAGEAEVTAAVRMAATVGPFFAVEIGRPEPGWSVLDAASLAGLTDAVAERLGTSERRVAASIMFQGLAARLVSPVLAALGSGIVLDLDPAATTVRSCPGEPMGLRCARVGGWLGEPTVGLVADVLLEQQLRPLLTVVAADGPVAEPLLWGNVASALVGALGQLPHPAAAAKIVWPLLAHGPLTGTSEVTHGAFRRRTCCLYYRTPAGGYCGDCALTR